jgi:hypothetical protein
MSDQKDLAPTMTSSWSPGGADELLLSTAPLTDEFALSFKVHGR